MERDTILNVYGTWPLILEDTDSHVARMFNVRIELEDEEAKFWRGHGVP